MAMTNIIPELWSSEIVALLEKNLVASQLTNRQITTGLMDKGDTLHIIGAGAVTTAAYADTGSNITYTAPSDTTADLSLDQDQYAALAIYDKEVKQAGIEWQSVYARRMAYELADDIDTNVLTVAQAGAGIDNYESSTTPWQLGAAGGDVPELFASVTKDLEDADAFSLPGRPYMVVPTIMAQAIRLYTSQIATNLGDSALLSGQPARNGYMGNYAGYDLYVSRNCIVDGTTVYALAGITGDGIADAVQISPNDIEPIRLEGKFGTGIRARALFGAAVYRSGIVANVHLNTTLLA